MPWGGGEMTNSIIQLEPVATCQPENESLPITQETDKPILMNASGAGPASKSVAVDPAIILAEITEHTSGWPKCAAGQLIVKSSFEKIRPIKNYTELFAWLYEHFDVMWRSSPGIPKSEFFEFCRNNTEQYDDVANYPHFPAVDGIFYDHPEPVYADGEALEQFLDFFTPATSEDRELIKGFLLTLFWGGPPGARPGFLITTTDQSTNQGRGWGKTTLLEICASLCGDMISFSKSSSCDAMTKRILTQANHEPRPRVLAIDNVKTRRFSSADLEALITERHISGHVMYQGNGSVPNLNTVGVTINNPSLSKDLAQRFVVIKLGKPTFTPGWQQQVETFVKANKWKIIGDIEHIMVSEGHTLPESGTSRHGAWEAGVLSKLDSPQELRDVIKNRGKDFDDDAAIGFEFHKFLEESLDNFQSDSNPIVRLTHVQMQNFLKDFLGEPVSVQSVKKKVDAIGLPCIHQVNKPGKPRVWLFRRDGEPLTSEQINQVMYPLPD